MPKNNTFGAENITSHVHDTTFPPKFDTFGALSSTFNAQITRSTFAISVTT